jgi:hypothetical protein
MIETYEKRGVAVRVERNGRATSTIISREHGRALRERGHFRAETCGERPLAIAPDVAGALETARRIASLERGSVTVERVTVVAGFAEHSVSYGGDVVSWSEEVARVHLSLVHAGRGLRAGIDLGSDRVATIPLEFAADAARALDAVEAPRSPYSGLAELAPPVAASLWRVVAAHPALLEDSRLRLEQSTHPSWPFDGAGRKVEAHPVDGDSPPAHFRPSFRAAPVPAWFHLRASLPGVGRLRRRAGFRIVALLSPFALGRSTLSARVLAASGADSFAMRLELPREGLAGHVVRISRRAAWFPLEAGAWGSDTLVDGVRLTPTE